MLGDTNPVYFFIAGGIPILDFAIYLNDKKLSEDSYLEVLYTENHLQKTAFVSVPSLDPLTSYNFSALALNSRSLCNFAPVVGPERMVNTTNVTAPSMPNLAKYKATGGGITMTMINPHDSGGKSIQTYRLYYKENATTTPWQLGYNGSKHQATVAHLKPLTYYVFMTSVNNGFFDSVNSSEKSFEPPIGPLLGHANQLNLRMQREECWKYRGVIRLTMAVQTSRTISLQSPPMWTDLEE